MASDAGLPQWVLCTHFSSTETWLCCANQRREKKRGKRESEIHSFTLIVSVNFITFKSSLNHHLYLFQHPTLTIIMCYLFQQNANHTQSHSHTRITFHLLLTAPQQSLISQSQLSDHSTTLLRNLTRTSPTQSLI